MNLRSIQHNLLKLSITKTNNEDEGNNMLYNFVVELCVGSLPHYGVSYGSVDLGGNRYLNSFLISIVELPSNFAIVWSAGRSVSKQFAKKD